MKKTKLFMMVSALFCFSAIGFAQGDRPMGHEPGMKRGMSEEMRAEMKAMDDRLDKLVGDMNAAATPNTKIDAAVAVINEMVAQHKKMHERLAQHGMPHEQ
jgi:hypothetical protein